MLDYSSLPYDILHQFCLEVASSDFATLRTLSSVDRRTRAACIPLLFGSIAYTRQWGDKCVQWEGATEALETLQKNPAILDVIRNAHIQPWVWIPEQKPFPRGFFDLIFSGSLDKLVELKLVIQKESTEAVKAFFNPFDDSTDAAKYPQLPNVKSLTIRSLQTLFFLANFPAITSLEIMSTDHDGSKLDLESIALVCPLLTRLHCLETGTGESVDALARWFPNIEDVGFYGGYGYKGVGADGHMSAFSKLKRLTTLNLPDASSLSMGFSPPWCGNAYFNNPGLVERVARERVETIRRLMDAIELGIIAVPGSKLSRVVIGSPRYGMSDVWEVEGNGKLVKSKLLQRDNKHGRIVRIQEVTKESS